MITILKNHDTITLKKYDIDTIYRYSVDFYKNGCISSTKLISYQNALTIYKYLVDTVKS